MKPAEVVGLRQNPSGLPVSLRKDVSSGKGTPSTSLDRAIKSRSLTAFAGPPDQFEEDVFNQERVVSQDGPESPGRGRHEVNGQTAWGQDAVDLCLERFLIDDVFQYVG
tara:strand:- start:53 stop:379 length:327 start_codon:yes stop_codon:yes gene_type:complete